MSGEMILNGSMGAYQSILQTGLRLADLPQAEGGWKEYFSESDEADLRIEDPYTRASTALMMENAKHWLAQMSRARIDPATGNRVIDETTRAAMVGGWSDFLFPIIRAAFPTNPINDLVSVQPTTRRVATVVYWNWIVGRGKGAYKKGQRLFDANRGKQDSGFHFSDEVVEDEQIGVGNTSDGTVADSILAFNDGGGIRPGTVVLSAYVAGPTLVQMFDDGNGNLIGGSAGAINYQTGAITGLDFGAVLIAQPVTATYQWDSEGSSLTPQVDVQIISSSVETQRRALSVNYSIEAMQDVMAEFGVALEPSLVSGSAEQLNFEIARQLIHEMWTVAPIAATFPIANPITNGFSQQEHFRDLAYVLNVASNSIWKRTQKGYGNWIVCDEGAASVIESLPSGMFQAAPRPNNVQGLHFIGTLLNKFRVYKDIHLENEPGAATDGNMLMGYKGNQFFEAGLVYSPYQLLYTTDTLTRSNFVSEKGMASRYATKMVNSDFYVRINLLP